MKLRLDATPQELLEKSDRLVESLSDLFRSVNPELSEALEKALLRKEPELKFPVLRAIQKKEEAEYERQMGLMVKEIGKVLDRSIKKSDVERGLEKSGPYIGPRGGKWADPQHTIPWKEDVSGERLTKEAHHAVKGEIEEAAHRAVNAGADAKSLKYVGAGAEGIIFEDKNNRAYKVARFRRDKERLRNEAEALQSLIGTPAEKYVPKVYKYDPSMDVLVRDKVEGSEGGWGTRGLREAYDEIVKELRAKEWTSPEYKEDSFIVSDGDPKMVDVGFVHPIGKRSAKRVEEFLKDAKPKDIDFLDTGFEITQLLGENAIDWDTAKKWARHMADLKGRDKLETQQFLESLEFTGRHKGYIKQGEHILEKAGPYIGPRGGKWADAMHTIPYRDPVSDKRYNTAAELLQQSSSLDDAISSVRSMKKFQDTLYVNGEDVPIDELVHRLESFKPKPIPEGKKMITVYHSTDRATASRILKDGYIPASKPMNLARQRWESGEHAEFAPGRGVSGGIYVGSGKGSGVTEGFGEVTLKLHVPEDWLHVSPEQKVLGVKDPGVALDTADGAVIHEPIHPAAISVASGSVSKADSSSDFVGSILEGEEERFENVKRAFISRGYRESDFDPGGPLYGLSTNELIDLIRDKRDD